MFSIHFHPTQIDLGMQTDVAKTQLTSSVEAMASYPSRRSSVATEAFILLCHDNLFPYLC